MKKFREVMVLVVIATFMLSVSSVQATTYWWQNSGGEWQDEGWVSTASDEIVIGAHVATVARVASSGNVANKFNLGAAAIGGTSLLIESGDLTIGSELKFDIRNTDLGDTLEISGGTLTIDGYVNIWSPASVMRIVGSGGTLAGNPHVNNAGTVEFVVNETGITEMPWKIGNIGGTGTISLKSDGAAPGKYQLFTMETGVATNLNFVADSSFDITNINTWGHEDYGVAVVVPEPCTIALVGLGFCGVIRRRLRK